MQQQDEHDAQLAVGSRIGDHFVVERLLGAGGMGAVYLAEHIELPDIKRAVKMLRREFSNNEQFVEALRSEARKQSRLQHDSVVQILDFFEQSGRYCLIQSYIPGETVGKQLEKSPGGLPLKSSLDLICEVLSGLNHAHEKGILHCDIKPANIIVDLEGKAKITDFGIARDLQTVARDQNLTSAGTLEYMSPEQLATPAGVDHRTDVYSTGVTLFEMLCGRLPFEGEAQGYDSFPQLRLEPPDIRRVRPDIPEDVARIILTAMQRERDKRFAGCADFITAIARYRWREEWRRKWRPLLIAAAVVAAVGGYGFWQWKVHLQEAALQKALVAGGESIGDAAKSLASLCREAEEREVKRAAPEMAKRMNDQRRFEQFTLRVKQMDANIEAYTQSYFNALNGIADLPPQIRAQFESSALRAVGNEETRWATQFAVSDYEARRSVPIPNTSATLLGRCPAAARNATTG